ncbi:hypothetical protein G432_09635 [Sphingomonas sp. MM-1]|uniref:hypothetical protein n=1 Tax=Sphingomonas sp. MM-1 TaxID=745310 RepID=UPI0002C14773|nr:hypothetical protein [Sphingomonas sp. MM-1]AGH49652.1 hypothetical protein G432_09635 [Sphingomonas sp. MM-1]
MKPAGAVITIIGVFFAILALSMDVSVETSFGSVNNIGLMNDQRNYLFLSGLTILIGVLLIIFGKPIPKMPDQSDIDHSKYDVKEKTPYIIIGVLILAFIVLIKFI